MLIDLGFSAKQLIVAATCCLVKIYFMPDITSPAHCTESTYFRTMNVILRTIYIISVFHNQTFHMYIQTMFVTFHFYLTSHSIFLSAVMFLSPVSKISTIFSKSVVFFPFLSSFLLQLLDAVWT